jgi:hypothetical protein
MAGRTLRLPFFTVTPSNSFPLRPLRLSAFALKAFALKALALKRVDTAY